MNLGSCLIYRDDLYGNINSSCSSGCLSRLNTTCPAIKGSSLTSIMRLFNTLSLLLLVPLVVAGLSSKPLALHRSRYSKAYSLGDSYDFDSRDGWQFVNVSSRAYKDTQHLVISRDHNKPQSGDKKGLATFLEDVFRRLKGLGSFSPVTITWYTGHDLKNPSCWSQSKWNPTVFRNADRIDSVLELTMIGRFIYLRAYPRRLDWSSVLL